jgi:membrane fusion protein (multidrug efflux system)
VGIKRRLKIAIGAGLVGALALLAYEVFFWFTHVYENNARIQTDLTNISAQVNGKIEKIEAAEGSRVTKGQLLIVLTHDDIKLAIESLRTDLRLAQAERARLLSEKSAFEVELQSKLETQRERIEALELEHRALKDRLQLAERNLARVRTLFDKKLTPEASLTVEQDKVLILRGDISLLDGRIAVARKELEQLRATKVQIDVITDKIRIADIEQTRIGDSIRQQEVELGYRHIVSPIDGLVGRIYHFEGEYLEDGVHILMLHDPGRFWVEAYVDESEIRHVRVGQDVRINLEAYPFWRDFFGKVRQIGSATVTDMGLGARVANGGRFGGAVERVPVRISLDDPPPNLVPGMRARINVRIYESVKLW